MKQEFIEDVTVVQVKNLIGQWRANKIFLVTGQASYVSSGASDFIADALAGIPFVRFSEFEQNPKFEDALRGTEIFEEAHCDAIIAIGGGSVMDMAKLINAFAANKGIDALNIITGASSITRKGKPLLAIPTTAGTGSEATHFAVVYHNNKKYSVAHMSLLPDVAGLNYEFTTSQSSYLTACAAMDAFSQAMESYWSVEASQESMGFSMKALRLLNENMAKAVNNPTPDNRRAVAKAAYWAGRAINITKTTAPHAVSYAFTTFYGIPHGHAVFLTLPKFLVYNYGVSEVDLNDPRGIESVTSRIKDICSLLGVDNVIEARKALETTARTMGVEMTLEAMGVTGYEELVARNVNLERLGNNPRKISEVGLQELLKMN